ncbi:MULTISPECIES: hypothetical protein [Hyphobacterium]|uniref:GGDEF domain-containing protein n=1 Tax=Hyphobacterium vulgare TaxID=1736751 RepID=A0ABV6ZUN4_9PROT
MFTMNSADILHRLEQKLHGRDHADLGQFQIINLDRVREGAGNQWERLKSKIFAVSAHFIEKRISAEDVLVRCNEGFLVVFDALDAPAAAERVNAISTELNLFFLGDEILRSLNVRSSASRLDTAELHAMFAVSGRLPAQPDLPGDPSAESVALAPRRRVIDIDFRRERSVIYRPIWDATRNAIATQFVVPRLIEKRTRQTYFGRDTLRGRTEPRDHLELDRHAAHAGMNAFRTAFGKGRTVALCLPVGIQSLALRSTRVALFETLTAIPCEMRRYFRLMVEGIGPGTPVSTIRETLGICHAFSPGVIVSLGRDPLAFDRFSGCHVAMFVTDGSDPRSLDDDRQREIASERAILRGAAGSRAATCLTGFVRESDIAAALRLGVRLLAGPAIADDFSHPVIPHILTREDIRRRAASRHLV